MSVFINIYDILYFQEYIVLGLVLLITMYHYGRRKPHFHSRWNTLIDNFSYSTHNFYDRVEKKLREKEISGITFHKINRKEGNMFSDKRLYLRVSWRNLQYDVCASPFATGFFVSWWLMIRLPKTMYIFNSTQYVGQKLIRLFYPDTHYKQDTTSMFMSYCHQAVMECTQEVTQDKGTRALTESERTPILRNIFTR